MTRDIGAVAGHVNGKIAHDSYPTPPAILMQSGPLSVEFESPISLGALAELGLFPGHEGCKIVKPTGVPFTVAVEIVALTLVMEECLRRLGQNREFPLHHRTVVDVCLRKLRSARHVLPAQVAAAYEPVEAEEQRVTGERREALYGESP